jgi:WD40 repeat protein
MLLRLKRLILVIFVAVGLIAPMNSTACGQAPAKSRARPVVPKLPDRALLQIGTNNLRMRHYITQLVFSPGGKQIAAVAANEAFPTVNIFDVATGMPAKELRVPDEVQSRTTCLAFSPDGKKLLWGESDGHLALWDLAGDRLLFREKLHTAEVTDAVYSPRGDVVASCSSNGEVQLRQASNLSEPVRLIRLGDADAPAKRPGMFGVAAGYVIAFTPNGQRLLVGSKGDGKIYVWNLADGELVPKIEEAHGEGRDSANPSLNALAVTPDGRRLMTAGQRTVRREETKLKYVSKNVTLSQICFWDLKSGKRVCSQW